MKLLRLETKNFMPFKGRMEVEFPSDPARNVMVVFGDNMRGKTSLLNAIRWALYGKALGRNSRQLPLQDMVNVEAAAEGDWTLEACVMFEANGETYELRRRANRGRLVSRPSRPEDFEIVRGLKRSGQVVPDSLIDSEIALIAPEETSRFFLFDGELLKEYEELLVDNSDQGRLIKSSIEQALGVPTLLRGRDDAATLLKGAQRQQTKDLERREGLERHSKKQAELQATIDAYERDRFSLQAQHRTIRDEREQIDIIIQATERVHVAKERLNSLLERKHASKDRLEEIQERRRGLLHEAWRDVIRPQISARREILQRELQRIGEEHIHAAKLQVMISQYNLSLGEYACGTCGQPLSAGHRDGLVQKISQCEAELSKIVVDDGERAAIRDEIAALEKLLVPGTASELVHLENESARLRVELTRLEAEISEVSDEIAGADSSDTRAVRERGKRLTREEIHLEHSIRSVTVKIEQAQRELDMISKAIQSAPSAQDLRSTQLVKIASDLELIYRSSVDRLRDHLKERVEKYATAAFMRMTTEQQYQGLKINSGYGLSILDANMEEVAIRSAGAEQIVALSLIDGLSKAGRAAGPVVMDTPFGRLDPKHRANILSYLPEAADQLVLFVHDGEFDRNNDLALMADRIGGFYEIDRVSSRHSRVRRVTHAI